MRYTCKIWTGGNENVNNAIINHLIEEMGMEWKQNNNDVKNIKWFYLGVSHEPWFSDYNSELDYESSDALDVNLNYVFSIKDMVIENHHDQLQECYLQIEYLNEKFGETGTSNKILGQIKKTFDDYNIMY